jgi:hypothetical protein
MSEGAKGKEGRLTPDGSGERNNDRQEAAMRALLKRSLAVERWPSLLSGVQKRIRQRSRGKFFGDGWSTRHAAVSPLLLGLITLLIALLAYLVLTPWGIH